MNMDKMSVSLQTVQSWSDDIEQRLYVLETKSHAFARSLAVCNTRINELETQIKLFNDEWVYDAGKQIFVRRQK